MKEKLKKVFTNKEFWTALIGCIGLLLSIVLSYSMGFKDGFLLDNSVRTELIEKTHDESKINKKRRNLNDFEYDAIPYGKNTETEIIVDLGYIIQNMIEYKEDLIAYASSNMPYQTYLYPLFITQDLFDATNNYYCVKIYSITKYNSGVALRVETRKCTIGTLSNGSNYVRGYSSNHSDNILLIGNDYSLTYSNNSDYSISKVYTNTFYDTLLVYNSPTSSATTYTFGTYNLALFDICNIGAYTIPSSSSSQEDLEQAYQNGFDKGKSEGKIEGYNEGYQDGLNEGFTEEDIYNSYLNGFDKGKSEGRIEGYNEGLQVGKEIGYQNRIDSVEDTEQKINSVWTILENAITSVLNVLSFEILPGIPLYICIGVPILLAVLLWFIKMGQS